MNHRIARDLIDFRGPIRGCPDYQWLIADALADVYSSSSTQPGAPAEEDRWIVASTHPSGSDGRVDYNSQFLVLSDQLTGWTEKALSAADLAERIRETGLPPGYSRAA